MYRIPNTVRRISPPNYRLPPVGRKINLSMQDLPLEVVYNVATFFEPTGCPSLLALMRTCRHVCHATEYHRYSSVVIFGDVGSRLMISLLSGTPTSQRYCSRVKRLWFRGWNDANANFNTTLLSQVLPLLNNLCSFWIEINPQDPTQFIDRMKRSGVVREDIHPTRCIGDIMCNGKSWSRLTLPRLSSLRLTGSPWVTAFTHHRPLKELELNSILQLTDFANLVTSIENTILQQTLKALSIRLGRCIDITLAFPILARTFPALNRLSFEQTSVEFETILEQLAFDTSILSSIKILVVNRHFSHAIVVTGANLPKTYPILDVMDEYLERIVRRRPGMECIGMGRTIWTQGIGGRFIRKTLEKYPDPWYKDFGSNFRECRFDPRQLPPFIIEIADVV